MITSNAAFKGRSRPCRKYPNIQDYHRYPYRYHRISKCHLVILATAWSVWNDWNAHLPQCQQRITDLHQGAGDASNDFVTLARSESFQKKGQPNPNMGKHRKTPEHREMSRNFKRLVRLAFARPSSVGQKILQEIRRLKVSSNVDLRHLDWARAFSR